MATTLKVIPLNRIRENPVALRTVNKATESYLGLVDSIRQVGVMNAITVRELTTEGGETIYGLVDGLHRFNAAADAGLREIPAQVLDIEEARVLEAQVIANVHKVETKPVEYSKQLMKILTQNPLLTSAELCTKLAKSPKWLSDRLGLTKLDDDIGKLVDSNEMQLSNAYALAKLPKEEQKNFLDRALTMSPQQFVPTVSQRIKEIRDAKRAGRTPGENVWQPIPHIKKVSELKSELDNPQFGPTLVKQLSVKTPEEGFKLGIQWALSLDPNGVEVQKANEEKRKREMALANENRKRERLEQKAQEARQKAAEIQQGNGAAATTAPVGAGV